MKYAIIDLGTNTCNLLIAETKATGYSILHQSKELVKLGDNQISNNALSDAAMQRAVNVLRLQREISESNRAEKIIVIATSAVRDAVNKSIFRKLIKRETGLELKIISGEKEADLIFKGVLLALNTLDTPAMILDIGGGSNEIIISKSKTMLWKESRPAGMARVINKFALSDPICDKEIRQLSQFFKAAHAKSIDFSKKEKVTTLIGCSGAFDTIADIIDQANPGEKQRISQKVEINDFKVVYNKLIASTRNERLQLKGMDYVRVDLIVPAIILIDQLIKDIGITEIIQTDFALREGVLYEQMLQHQNS